MTTTLYMTGSPRTAGDWPASPDLLTELRSLGNVTTAYMVHDSDTPETRPHLVGEVIRLSDIESTEFDLIVVEHWLSYSESLARIPLEWLSNQVAAGAQLLLMNFHQDRDFDFTNRLIPATLMRAEDGPGALYGYDELAQIDRDPRFLWCELSTMYGVATYLKPAYDGFRGVGVGTPRAIWPLQDILATADQSTVRKLSAGDHFQDDDHLVVWATVRTHGYGHVLLTSGDVSAPYTLKHCPDNLPWLLNVIEVLTKHTVHLGRAPKDPMKDDTEDLTNPTLDQLSVGLSDDAAARVLERLAEGRRCFNGSAYLSCVIMLGSALEAALDHMITERQTAACRSAMAPRGSTGKVKDSRQWRLAEMIDVAADLKWLHPANANFSHVLRDYRNYVHPRRAAGDAPIDEHAARLCWQVATGALEDLVSTETPVPPGTDDSSTSPPTALPSIRTRPPRPNSR